MRLALGVAVLVGAVLAPGGVVAGAAPFTPDPQHVILRLSDLGPGYRVGHGGGGCPAERGQTDMWVTNPRHRVTSCAAQFVDNWYPPSPSRLATVDSGAFVFETESGAAESYESHRRELTFTERIPDVHPLPSPPQIGDRTTMYSRGSPSDTGHTTALVWRTGRVISYVTAYAGTKSTSEQGAGTLARRQQERLLVPTPVGPRDNDNTRAFLDDPRLDVDIYWLDESFDPAGPLPRRDLLEADYWHGPGWKARIMYGGAIDLGLWNPKRWQRFKHSRLGRRFLCEPCAKRTRLRVGGRRVTVFASRTPRLFIGAVRIRDTVVSVNFPICFSCATGRDPYNSARGMRAIAAGLTLRVPTPY